MARIFVDEAHQVFSAREYRPKFKQLGEIAKWWPQKIYLSASIPMRMMSTFFEWTFLPRQTIVVKAPCYQPQLSYHIGDYLHTAITPIQIFKTLIPSLGSKLMTAKDRAIIFVCESKDCDAIADRLGHLGVTKTYSTLMDREVNEQKWLAGQSPWIVSTTRMIHGIDCSSVRIVIFMELPYGLINVYQGAGRAGRDEKPAHIFALNSINSVQLLSVPADDYEGKGVGVEWLRAKECHRIAFHQLFDGTRVQCSELDGALPCNFCDPHTEVNRAFLKTLEPLPIHSVQTSVSQPHLSGPPLASSSYPLPQPQVPQFSTLPHHTIISGPTLEAQTAVAYAIAQYQSKQQKINILDKFGQMIKGQCVVCWCLYGVLEIKTPEHSRLKACRKNKGYVPNLIGSREMKRRFHFADYSACYYCGFPQDPTLLSHGPFQGQCELDDTVVQLLWFTFHNNKPALAKVCANHDSLCRYVEEECDANILDISVDQFFEWCTRTVDSPTMFYNGLEFVVVFLRLFDVV
jgi:hypothetical protein